LGKPLRGSHGAASAMRPVETRATNRTAGGVGACRTNASTVSADEARDLGVRVVSFMPDAFAPRAG